MSYTAPTLLTFADSPVPFNQLVPRWFEVRAELSDAFVLLMAPYYVPSLLVSIGTHRHFKVLRRWHVRASVADKNPNQVIKRVWMASSRRQRQPISRRMTSRGPAGCSSRATTRPWRN